MSVKHQPRCLIYLCTCLALADAIFDEDEHRHDCDCDTCRQEIEAARDREFDEKVALGFI